MNTEIEDLTTLSDLLIGLRIYRLDNLLITKRYDLEKMTVETKCLRVKPILKSITMIKDKDIIWAWNNLKPHKGNPLRIFLGKLDYALFSIKWHFHRHHDTPTQYE